MIAVLRGATIFRMSGQTLARIVVLLLFVVQALAPFLHAHAGNRLPATGELLHIHLHAAPTFEPGGGHGLQTDVGRIVVVPPEVRRDDSLAVADKPVAEQAAVPAHRLASLEVLRGSAPLSDSLVLRVAAPPLLARARAPPASL